MKTFASIVLTGTWAILAAIPSAPPPAGSGPDPEATSPLTVESVQVRDLDGDQDMFADAGETVRLTLVLRNHGPVDLRNIVLRLRTDDSDVACITRPIVQVPLVPAGGRTDTAGLGMQSDGFQFVVSERTETVDAAFPATAGFRLDLIGGGTTVREGITRFDLPLDLDLPGGPPVPVAGPDGIAGTADDGRIVETFDADRDGDGSIRAGFLPGTDRGNDTIGIFVGTAAGYADILAGVGCGGFRVPPEDPECRIEPDDDMDWHLHCPSGASAAACPNAPLHRTPGGGSLAYNGDNALHWGIHLDPVSTSGDSVHFRQLAAFVTGPINLEPFPDPGALELSFAHIAVMMDHNNLTGFKVGHAADFGDVQVQIDGDSDPEIDSWGYWDKLVPFENVYDHIAYVWSSFGTSPTYCVLTPADAAPDPASPRGVRELLCHPQGVWSSCGSNAPNFRHLWNCQGPGLDGSHGGGLWVRTRFDLQPYAGRRIRIRWIAQSWEFDCCSSSYYEIGPAWEGDARDDGWWIDDLRIEGAVETQATPVPDDDPPGGGRCAVSVH